MDRRPIGIFDSGVGGLTVLGQINKLLPSENIIYFGDTARVPYGNKSKPTVINFSRQSIDFLLRKKVKMVVVACNTASALALDNLKKTFNLPIVGVIEAGAKKAVATSLNGRIAVIGTKSTIASRSYEKEIRKIRPTARIYSQSCPLFVPLAEEGMLKGEIVNKIIKLYLGKITTKRVDSLILGCTHYPLLKKAIAKYLNGVYIVDSAASVASEVKALLAKKKMLNSHSKGRYQFYVSDQPASFGKLAKLFLSREVGRPKIANV